MSGEKRRYVSVEQRELQRLRQQESRLRSLQQDLPERINAVQQQVKQEFQQQLNSIETRSQRQQQENQQLRTNLKNLDRETKKRLQKQQEEFKGKIQQVTQDQRNEYLHLIEQQNQKFKELNNEQKALQKDVQQIANQIEQDEEKKANLAKEFLVDVETISEQIQQNYQHERFAPGCLTDLNREINLARSNIESGITEAAIATSQQCYLKLADLRLELEQKEQEWQLFYNATLSDLRTLITEVEGNRECEVEVGEGEESEKFKLEVDYWVNGRLSNYEEELKQIETQLVDEASTLKTEEVKQLGEKINQLQPILGEILEEAKLNLLSSHLRVEIADSVVKALSSAGFNLVNPEADATYEGNDQRNSYVVKVKNIAGDEVVTVISPGKDFGTNAVSINTFSQTLVDETATQQNANAIFELLEKEGVQGIGKIECREKAKAEYQNLDEVKQRQVKPESENVQQD